MSMFPKATEIWLDPETRSTLEGWVRASSLGDTRSAGAQGAGALDLRADLRGARRRRHQLRPSFPPQAKDQSRRTEKLVRKQGSRVRFARSLPGPFKFHIDFLKPRPHESKILGPIAEPRQIALALQFNVAATNSAAWRRSSSQTLGASCYERLRRVRHA
jgi:hypothetical protein